MFSNDDKKDALIKKTAEAIIMLQNISIYKKNEFFTFSSKNPDLFYFIKLYKIIMKLLYFHKKIKQHNCSQYWQLCIKWLLCLVYFYQPNVVSSETFIQKH